MLNPQRRTYLDPKDAIQPVELNGRGLLALKRVAAFLKEPQDQVSHFDLVGCKIDVYYSKPASVQGWWQGIVRDYEPKLGGTTIPIIRRDHEGKSQEVLENSDSNKRTRRTKSFVHGEDNVE